MFGYALQQPNSVSMSWKLVSFSKLQILAYVSTWKVDAILDISLSNQIRTRICSCGNKTRWYLHKFALTLIGKIRFNWMQSWVWFSTKFIVEGEYGDAQPQTRPTRGGPYILWTLFCFVVRVQSPTVLIMLVRGDDRFPLCFFFGFSHKLDKYSDLKAEIWGSIMEFDLTRGKGYCKIVIESDSVNAIKLLWAPKSQLHPH